VTKLITPNRRLRRRRITKELSSYSEHSELVENRYIPADISEPLPEFNGDSASGRAAHSHNEARRSL
jgi:hypothetical protein